MTRFEYWGIATLERQVAWYPGHMAKAARRIREYLRSIDIVVEIVDARIARSGRNPLLDELGGQSRARGVLNRQDLADPRTTKRWLQHFAERGSNAVAVDGRSQRSVARVAAAIASSSSASRAGFVARDDRRRTQLGQILDRQCLAGPCGRKD